MVAGTLHNCYECGLITGGCIKHQFKFYGKTGNGTYDEHYVKQKEITTNIEPFRFKIRQEPRVGAAPLRSVVRYHEHPVINETKKRVRMRI